MSECFSSFCIREKMWKEEDFHAAYALLELSRDGTPVPEEIRNTAAKLPVSVPVDSSASSSVSSSESSASAVPDSLPAATPIVPMRVQPVRKNRGIFRRGYGI
jgi:hypothetical protein